MRDHHINNNPSHEEDIKIKLCTYCGFPNKPEDSQCLYCRKPFNNMANKNSDVICIGKREKVLYSFINSTSRLIKGDVFKKISYLLIASVFIVVGLFLFFFSIMKHNFTSWAISILLLIYGVCAFIYVKKPRL